LGAALICAGTTFSASAAAVFPWDDGAGGHSAQATFNIVNEGGKNFLTVLLENTSMNDVMVPTDVLTAVFWDPTANLTPVSATLPLGSFVKFGGVDSEGGVGGEWAYKSGLSGTPGGAVLGISSTGVDLFGKKNLFPPGENLQGPASVDGLQYGITSAGDDFATGNSPVTGDNALIKNSVLFKLMIGDGTGTYDLAGIENVNFLYGTSLGEVPNVPEPTTVIAGALLLLPFGLTTLQMVRKNRKM
jgi:hypothetical protein